MTYYRTKEMALEKIVFDSTEIKAPVKKVWDALTDTAQIRKWMLETDVEIFTTWEPGSSIKFIGDLHGLNFENRGTVLRFEPYQLIEYNYWSTLSEIPDEPQNYTVVEFRLHPKDEGTLLSLQISDFATEVIRKHVEFYWKVTLDVFRKFVEEIENYD